MSMVLAACLVAGAVVIAWPARRRLSWASPHAVVAGVGAAAAVGLVVGGPVLAVVAAAYAGLAGRALLRRTARRQVKAGRAASLAGLVALAADLRAGLPPTGPVPGGFGSGETTPGVVVAGGSFSGRFAMGRFAAGGFAMGRLASGGFASGGFASGRAAPGAVAAGRLERLTASVWRLAERTGAPAADLVERIEADARAADRAADAAAAQAAGAQATALLLAGLPAGGIGLGIGIGADPIGVLLHTPLGAACAIGAVVLQSGGLIWTERLTAGVAR
ncbi:hypothetical protein ACQPZX_01675 [Actinoplanes sp. CA-142083]|uniref:hypothetical protein n=1 Tax=Actinoplanes sp. CA-142083 TaxID=3239903 RepID=UPI003D923B6C